MDDITEPKSDMPAGEIALFYFNKTLVIAIWTQQGHSVPNKVWWRVPRVPALRCTKQFKVAKFFILF